jgi:hypothetical protein
LTSVDREPTILTLSGIYFPFLNPKAEHVRISDIAHALSMTCRWGGHARRFYSVAEHCVRVSHVCELESPRWGLLHDGAEAYLPDLASPIKRCLSSYQALEVGIQTAICVRFGLDLVEPESVKRADKLLLVTEGRDVAAPSWPWWHYEVMPMASRIVPWTQESAKDRFLERFAKLFPNETIE